MWHVWASHWSPDSQWVFARADPRDTVEFWNLGPKGKRYALPNHWTANQAAVWSADGQWLAAPCIHRDQCQVRIWQPATGRLRLNLGLSSTGKTWWFPVDWSPAGNILATSAANHTVQFWNGVTGARLTSLPVKHKAWVHTLGWSPDGKMLVTFANDAWLWDPVAKRPLRPLKGKPIQWVGSLAWSLDGKLLATADRKRKEVDLWDVSSGKHRGILAGHEAGVTSLAWSPDGRILASGSLDQTVRLWKASGDFLDTLKDPDGRQAKVTALAWLPGGKTLAVLGENRRVCWWEIEADSSKLVRNAPALSSQAAFSPDGRRLASYNGPTGIRLWDSETGQPRTTLVFLRPKAPLQFLSLGADGHYAGVPRLIERDLVYVVRTEQGQRTLTPEEFAGQYHWKNQPERAGVADK